MIYINQSMATKMNPSLLEFNIQVKGVGESNCVVNKCMKVL